MVYAECESERCDTKGVLQKVCCETSGPQIIIVENKWFRLTVNLKDGKQRWVAEGLL